MKLKEYIEAFEYFMLTVEKKEGLESITFSTLKPRKRTYPAQKKQREERIENRGH